MRRREFIHRSARTLGALGAISSLTACDRSPVSNSAASDPTTPDGAHVPRIAAVSPALAITLRDLGLADRIVARHAWDMVLDLDVPIVGDQSSLDYEALLATDPTHVLLEWGVRPVPERLNKLARSRNWHVRSWSLLSHEQVRASFNEIASFVALGQPTASGLALASTATKLTGSLDSACAQRPMAARAGSILLLHSVAPPAALGPGSFHHEILGRLGGRPVLTSGNAYIELHMEDILRLAPDSIVIIEPRAPRASLPDQADPAAPLLSTDWPSLQSKLGQIATLQIPAIRDRRVAIIDDPLSLTPSSAMIGFAGSLGRILETWATARQG